MKKDRNTFFGESSQYFLQQQYPNPNINPNINPNLNSFTSQNFSGSFYQVPMNNQVPLNYNTSDNQMLYNNNNDFESRISKVERQINRLDARISKLEGGTFYSNEDIETTNNVYMV